MTRQIRPLREEDVDAVVGIWHRAGVAAYPYLPTWQVFTLEDCARVFREVVRPNDDVFVGLEGDAAVAYLALRGSYLTRLYVDPSCWRSGWGTLLLDHAKTLSPSGLELHTHQANTAARTFYEGHGFVAVRFDTSPAPELAPDVEYHWRPA